jgi:hypothetical protein
LPSKNAIRILCKENRASVTMTADSNSETAIESLVARCNESLQRGKDGGLASLTAYRDAGSALLELKEVLPRGQFGPVATERCRCSKQWRARLMQLAREWGDIRRALEWADGRGADVSDKAYSVDGALALLRAWRRIQSGKQPGTRRRRSGSKQSENIKLKQRLSAAVRYIAVVEEELADCAANPNGERQDLDPADLSKTQKVATLWLCPGTDGEGLAAAHKLRALARRYGWPIRDLLHECGIEGPADWTFASTL